MTTDSPARTEAASLRIGTDELELPIVRGNEGDDAIDIAGLRGETGLITLDPGYGNTGACTSAITFLDGEAGDPPLSRVPDRPAGRALDLPRGRLPADLGRSADAVISWIGSSPT